MENKILIIDIETTGFLPIGKIVEIGVVELDVINGEKKILYSNVVKPKGITRKEVEESWIVKNGYMNTEEIRIGKDLDESIIEVQKIIDEYPLGATAYNSRFDFDFLTSVGLKLGRRLPCPMILSTDICCLPSPRGYGFKWPKVEEAYTFYFGETGYSEKHRGADDAFHEADIVFELIKRGIFKY